MFGSEAAPRLAKRHRETPQARTLQREGARIGLILLKKSDIPLIDYEFKKLAQKVDEGRQGDR
jgi:hypothetical protein